MPALLPLLAIAGLGLAGAGTLMGIESSQKMAGYNQDIIKQEQQAEALRKQAMELDSHRKTMELLRQQQSARAISLATATAQGAQGSSGLAGAYGNISGQFGNNFTGLSNNLGFGEQMFGINSNINNDRFGIAGAQSDMALGQGLTSLGGQLISMGPTLGKISQGFGFNGFNTSGYNPYGTSSNYYTGGLGGLN